MTFPLNCLSVSCCSDAPLSQNILICIPSFFDHFLAFRHKSLRLHLVLCLPRPGINPFSKEPWFLVENSFWKPNSGRFVCSLLLGSRCSSPSQWTVLGYLWLYLFLPVYIQKTMSLHGYHQFQPDTMSSFQFSSLFLVFSLSMFAITFPDGEKTDYYYLEYVYVLNESPV